MVFVKSSRRWSMRRLSKSGLYAAGVAGVVLFMSVTWRFVVMPRTFDLPEPDMSQAVALEETFDEAGRTRLFVFGTLKSPVVRWLVTGSRIASQPAKLHGYSRHGLDIRENDDAVVHGLLLRVTERQLRRLDRYERLGTQYHRFQVVLADGEPAWVYQRL